MRILELFSGTKSFSKIAEQRGHTCYTIDSNPKSNPDLCLDIIKCIEVANTTCPS